MYIGRFIVVGQTWAGYRVSSRSFPHRKIVEREDVLTVTQTDEAPPTENPYIAYNCVRQLEETAIIGNGSHVDPIAEKVALGYPVRDALAHGLLTLDFEKDDYDTPRIAGTIGEESAIGIVRRDGIIVTEVSEPMLVATYEHDAPEPFAIDTRDAEGVAKALFDLDFEHPVCAAGVATTQDGFVTAVYNGPEG